MSEQQSSADSAVPMTHPRHNVYFMCQCCEEENPENAVCCREDIAVMPDGTWLCDNCYSDCEKTAYGLVANDVEDFEFPSFEDLPRPAPYIDSAARTEPQTAWADIEDIADIIRDKAYADENDKIGGIHDAAQKIVEYLTTLPARSQAVCAEDSSNG